MEIRGGNASKGNAQVIGRCCHCRRQHGRSAMLYVDLCNLQCRIVAIHHVGPTAAMNMQVHKAGQHDWQRAVANPTSANRFAHDGSKQTPVDTDPPTNESARGQGYDHQALS